MSNNIEPNYARVIRKIQGLPTSDGAGVKLTRMIGSQELPDLDPFLLLDEFGTDKAEDYIAGFPNHPHRGFETVTYMLDGRMRHKDNHGHEGVLTPGAVQWMTAGRGIIHSEMPEQESGRMRGFQLWINLPSHEKMKAPHYQEYAPENIPTIHPIENVAVKVIAGSVAGTTGPVVQPATDPLYIDIELQPQTNWDLKLQENHNAFIHVFEGEVTIGQGDTARTLKTGELGVLGGGEVLQLQSGSQTGRLILVAGKPLREPIAKYGPFVMNTKEEIMQAFVDYQEGRF